MNLSSSTQFNEVYFESTRLSTIDTYVGYTQIRSGRRWMDSKLEAYAALRLGADTRTQFDSSGNIYNDNFAFGGLGVDYLGFIPGVRFTFQLGGSFDLSSKINEGGVDTRIGTQTYHEISWDPNRLFHSELYSEALYYRRYQNFLASIQFRTVYNALSLKLGTIKLELSPLMNLVASMDSAGFDYNRLAEFRIGPRITLRGPITLALLPQYVWGTSWAKPSGTTNYPDFRVLLTGFISI